VRAHNYKGNGFIWHGIVFNGSLYLRMNAKVIASQEQKRNFHSFPIFKRFITHKGYISCTRAGHKIVSLTTLNKYLCYDVSGTEMNINIGANNDSEEL